MCISDDPYYCGLRARVPNFVNDKKGGGGERGASGMTKEERGHNNMHHHGNSNTKPRSKPRGGNNPLSPPPSRSTPNLQNLAQLPGAAPPFWWHSRLYPDSGIGGKDNQSNQSPYLTQWAKNNNFSSIRVILGVK